MQRLDEREGRLDFDSAEIAASRVRLIFAISVKYRDLSLTWINERPAARATR